MNFVNYKGKEIDEAIRKVKAKQKDVSRVTAKKSDVVKGKMIIDSNKNAVFGTIGDASIQLLPEIKDYTYLTIDENEYEISYSQKNKVERQGVIREDVKDVETVKYINVEDVTLTPSAKEQVILPTENKLIGKVIINKIPASEYSSLLNYAKPELKIYSYKSSSTSSYIAKTPAGAIHNNIFLRSQFINDDVVVYLVPLEENASSSSISSLLCFTNPDSFKENANLIKLHKGDSFTSIASNFSPSAKLDYTIDGRLKLTINTTFELGSQYNPNTILLLYDGSIYYVVALDANKWQSGSSSNGSFVKGGTYRYSTYAEATIYGNAEPMDVINPNQIIENYTNLYFYTEFSSTSSYIAPTLKIGYGKGLSIIVEK